MSSSFWKRLPNFLIGLLLGVIFASVYVRERHLVAKIQPTPEFQKNLTGSFQVQKPLSFSLHLGEAWHWHKHFPASLRLLGEPAEGETRRQIQTWLLVKPEETILLPALPAGQYMLHFSLVLCTPKEKEPACVAQEQYYDFRVDAAVHSRTSEDIVLLPQAGIEK